jgi:hypothetical protein
MGMRGPGARGGLKAAQDLADATPASFPWLDDKLSRAERVIAFIEDLPVTKGILAGTKMRLLEFQKEFIRAIYDPKADDGRRLVGWRCCRSDGRTERPG